MGLFTQAQALGARGPVSAPALACCLDDALVAKYVWDIQCVLLSGL